MQPETIAIIYNIIEESTQSADWEREITIVAEALSQVGCQVRRIGVNNSLQHFLSSLYEAKPDWVFNRCEDVNSNNWGEIYIAGLLELMNIPYTGSAPLCLGISLDKAKAKDIMNSHGIPNSRYQVFSPEQNISQIESAFPVIVKPLYEDGSYGIDSGSVVTNREELEKKLIWVFSEYRQPAIVEEYIKGRELNVSLLGNGNRIQVLPYSEIDYSTMPAGIPRICSYNAKWEQDSVEYKNAVPVCPVSLPAEVTEAVNNICQQVYKIFGCRDYARVDIRLDKQNKPFVIDVNPNPCISPDSGFARSGKAAGIDYKELMRCILYNCKERTNGKHGTNMHTVGDSQVSGSGSASGG